jgi:hypothetical protein
MISEDERFLDWLSGFIDGEGCFQIACRKRVRNGRTHIAMEPEFRIELHMRDEAILHEIRRSLGFGKVKPIHTRGHRILLIAGTKSCNLLATVLDKHPLKTKKREDFRIWKKSIELFKNGATRSKDGLLKLARLKDSLNSHSSAKKRKNYWSYERIKTVLEKEVGK